MSEHLPVALYQNGFTDLISVVPPGAVLSPNSKIPNSALGKVPGRRNTNGTWGGWDWRNHETSIDDVKAWIQSGANIGLKADRFPGVDIDCSDPQLAEVIEQAALAQLGAAPSRIGKPPKRLLMYRTDEPFGRIRLWMKKGDEKHLVEILGEGQQYLVWGTHPSTMRPYSWTGCIPHLLPAEGLTEISVEKAMAFRTYLKDLVEMLGYETEDEGDGRRIADRPVNQSAFVAPSMDALREAVAAIPNSNDLFPSRFDYLKMGAAIRASVGDEPEAIEEAYQIFAEWAERWEGNDRYDRNDPDVVREDWRRIRPPFSVGWPWLAEQARQFGFNDAALDFEALEDAPESEDRAVYLSEQWLAEQIVLKRRDVIRFCPAHDKWYVWDGSRWEPDASLAADDIVSQELKEHSIRISRASYASEKEQAAAGKQAMALASAAKAASVKSIVKHNRGIAVKPESLDHDPWILNTPAGIVDLRTGKMMPADPDRLCSKRTSVAPDFGGSHPEWTRFLLEATGGDLELIRYLQKFFGYCLTGMTTEQIICFLWGPGGNGKSVMVNAITGILGDYAQVAPMDTFTSSQNDRHSTELAMLQGARMVTASETQAGKRWDEARIKSMSGGERITARYMRQDNFTFEPQFKLTFLGNHKPAIRDLDPAMRRRLHLVPFVIEPERVDRELGAKLRQEWPAILAWMIEGCLLWQREGLTPPAIVREATESYFEGEDAVSRWLLEACEEAPGERTEMLPLFTSWREWAGQHGEYPGTMRRLQEALLTRKLERWSEGRRSGFVGIKVRPQDVMDYVT